jgi:hypothetical protein
MGSPGFLEFFLGRYFLRRGSHQTKTNGHRDHGVVSGGGPRANGAFFLSRSQQKSCLLLGQRVCFERRSDPERIPSDPGHPSTTLCWTRAAWDQCRLVAFGGRSRSSTGLWKDGLGLAGSNRSRSEFIHAKLPFSIHCRLLAYRLVRDIPLHVRVPPLPKPTLTPTRLHTPIASIHWVLHGSRKSWSCCGRCHCCHKCCPTSCTAKSARRISRPQLISRPHRSHVRSRTHGIHTQHQATTARKWLYPVGTTCCLPTKHSWPTFCILGHAAAPKRSRQKCWF